MAIRELSSQEVQNVSGGTFGLLSFKLNLLGSLFGRNTCYTPAPSPCQPAPSPCQPAPKPCGC